MLNAHYMSSDADQISGAEVDYTPLLGTWVNLHSDTVYLLQVSLSQEGKGHVLHALGSSAAEPLELGPAPATLLVSNGTIQPQGFYACFSTPAGQTCLAATLNQGICVIQTYVSFSDGSGRTNYFSKEYFRLLEML